MFSAGSVFTSLAARVAPEGFSQYARLVADAKTHRVADIRLGALVEGSGFDRYARYVRMATGQTRDFSGSAKESFGSVSEAMSAMAGEGATAFTRLGAGLQGLRGEYMTVGEAAQHSAAMQKVAMAEMQGNMLKTEGAGAAMAGKMGAEGAKAGTAFSSQFGKAANMGRWATLGAGLGAVVSLKWAGDFQKNMELIRTEAGGTQKNVDTLSKSILNMAPAVGQTPKALAEGLYHVASGGVAAAKEGINTAKALDILKTAAQGARIGNASMEDVTNALVTTLRNSPKDIHSAREAMGVLIETVGHGNLRMRDLISAFSSGLPATGKALGLGMRDIAAALDVMTSRGVPAQQAANRLRTTLSLMEDPTSKASKALAQVGIAHDTVAKAFQSGGIVGGLRAVQEGLDRTWPKGRALTQDEYTAAIKRFNGQLDAMGVTGKARDKDMTSFKARLHEVGTAAIQQSKTIFDAFGGARMGTTMQILMQNTDDVAKHFEALNQGGARRSIDSFNSAVTDYSKTFSFQMNQLWAGIQSVGIALGDKLIPAVEKAAHAVEGFAKFLHEHKAAADALAISLGTGLVLAIGAFVTKMVLGMAESGKQLYKFGEQVGSLPAKLAQKTAAVVRGSSEETAAIDKTTAALVAQAEELGVVQAEMGKLALTGEAVTAGGLVVPGMPYSSRKAGGAPGSLYSATSTGKRAMTLEESLLADATMAGGGGGALAAEEKAISRPGFFSRMGSNVTEGGAKGLMGRAGGGMMIGLMGTMAAQMAGGIIGGKTGGAVSGIGSGVATGAGLGMLLGPEGALAGGVVGGLVGGLAHFLGSHQSEDYGKKIAKQVESGIGMLHLNVSAPTQKHVDAVIQTAGESIQKAQTKIAQGGDQTVRQIEGPHAGAAITIAGMSAAEKRKLEADIQSEYNKIGRAAAVAFDEGMKNGPKWQTSATFFHNMESSLRALPDQARTSAAKSMLVTAAELESEGRLPKGSMRKLVDDLGNEFGTMGPDLQATARHAMKLVETEIQQNKVVQRTQALVDDIGKTFADAPKVGKVTAHNTRKVWEEEMDFLKTHLHDKNQATADDAKSAWKAIHDESTHYANLMKKDVGGAINDLAASVSGSLGAMSNAADSASSSVLDSAKSIASQVNDMAKSLGAKGIHFTPAKTPSAQQSQRHIFSGGLSGTSLPDFSNLGGNIPGKAVGGIPNPFGTSMDDHILMSPEGMPVAALSGTEGILNAPQMGITDVALRVANLVAPEVVPYSGLGQMWGSGLRHYAHGGVLERANHLDRLHLPYVWGGHHGDRGIITNPDPGLDCSSAVSYVLGIPPRVSGAFADFGKPGPGAISIYYNPTHTFMKILGRYFGTSGFGHPKAGTGPAWFTTDPSASYLKGFGVRHVDASWAGMDSINPGIISGTGAMADIARSAQSKDARDANSWLQHLLDNLDSSGGQALADGSSAAAAPAQAKRWVSQGMHLAGVSGSLWAQMLLRQAGNESSFRAVVTNTSDINAALGDPSEGFLQLTGSNFRRFMVPGHNNINNPVDNTAAAIRYIISRYGKGNAARAVQIMWNRGGGAYALGGLLRRFQGGGAMAHAARATTTPVHTAHVAAPKKPKTHKPPVARKGPQVLPHSLGKVHKLADVDPMLGQIDEADQAIKAEDTTYGEDERYFNIVDTSLTPGDLGTLKDLRHTQYGQLVHEQDLDTQAGAQLTGLGSFNLLHQKWIQKEAQTTLNRINATKKKLTDEGRRLAKLRHVRAGKMLAMADQLAGKVAALADRRAALSARKKKVSEDFAKRISSLSARAPASITDQLTQIDKRYQPLIDRANTYQGAHAAKALHNKREAEKEGLRSRYHAAQQAHSSQMRGLRDARRAALDPIDKEYTQAVDETRHLRVTEAHHRRQYQKQGWNQAWSMQVEKYRLQDRLKTLQDTEKHLTGATTEIGSGGYLHELVQEGTKITEAQQALSDKTATLPSDIIDSALNQLDLAGQQAQAQATSSNQPQDIFSYIPTDILGTLQNAGLSDGDIHRVYQPAGTQVDAAGNVVDTTTGAPSAADIAQAAMAQVASMDAASAAIYQQFGSNTVGVRGLSQAVSPGAFGPGVAYFGAEGTGINAGLGQQGTGARTENNFNQTNNYALGPTDPHLHAQASRVQFENAFG